MKTVIYFFWKVLLLTLVTFPVFTGNSYGDRKELKFPRSRPGILTVISGEGNIYVEGYDGNTVIIETKTLDENESDTKGNEKARGMKRITGAGISVAVAKEHNAVIITRSMENEADLFIKVPYKTSLLLGGEKIRGVNPQPEVSTGQTIDVSAIVNSILASFNIPGGLIGANVTVSNISGDIEVGTLEGDITLTDVSGGVVANSLDGELLVTFNKVDRNKPMAFSSIDGDIDVTFPSDIHATVTAKTVDGDVYTGFEMDMTLGPDVIKVDPNPGVIKSMADMYRNTVIGKINGGGTDIQMSTVDGDIYIRKRK